MQSKKNVLCRIPRLFVVCAATLALVASAIPASAASNGKIAFSSIRSNIAGIWVMNPDGSGAISLISSSTSNFQDPVWSPDGSKIAFSSYTNSANSQIYVMGADGSNVTRLTNNAFSDVEPTWSPNGLKIAFVTNRDVAATNPLGTGIYVMNSDGTGVTRVTDAAVADDTGAAWSPDGTKIAFSTDEGTAGNHIAVINPDGTGRTGFPAALGRHPGWSPDGPRLYTVATPRSTQTARFL